LELEREEGGDSNKNAFFLNNDQNNNSDGLSKTSSALFNDTGVVGDVGGSDKTSSGGSMNNNINIDQNNQNNGKKNGKNGKNGEEKITDEISQDGVKSLAAAFLERIPQAYDAPTYKLLEFLSASKYICPEDWNGYRFLTKK
jgi:hypothetical protein